MLLDQSGEWSPFPETETARADAARARRGRVFNRLRLIFDRELTAANGLDRAAAAHPDSPVFHLDEPLPYRWLAGRSLTCRQILAFVNRLGNVLRQAGMERHDRVAVWKTNSPDYLFLSLAIIKAGGISVPINPGMSPEALDHYLRYTGSKILVTDAETFARRAGEPGRLPAVETWVFPRRPRGFEGRAIDLEEALESASEELEPVCLDPDSEVLIVHTSGTTGFPKGVISTSGGLVAGIKGHYLDEPVGLGGRAAIAAPFHHLVSQMGLYSSLLGNLPVWTVGRFDPGSILELLERQRIQFFFAFPDVYLKMLEHGLEGHDLSSMRVWISGADASHEAHMQTFCRQGAFLRLFGRPLMGSVFMDCLGSSEIGFAALTRLAWPFSKPRLERLVGRPSFAAPRVKVADEEGRELPPGQAGRLMVKGPTLFKGYWNAQEKLLGTVRDGWWWTGDVVRRDRLGRFYHLDRATDVIHERGGPVYTLPTEEVLLSHPDVAEAVVIGLPHPRRGEAPFALFYPRPGHTLEPETLRAWSNARLPAAGALEEVAAVSPDEIPRGLTGKVLKRTLRDRYASRFVPLQPANHHP